MAQIPVHGMKNEEPAGEKLSTKVRLEFLVPAEECELATEAIEKMGGEAMIYESESCGCKKKKFIMSINKGTDRMEIKNPTKRTVVSIVDAEKANDIVAAVAGAVNAGSSSVIRSPVYGVETL